ncbi:NnrS family protein [uncultured Piscinibacter sp.]|uniref:NnrS family protein n=1 Tax=uncultured Piscinibacter sp. TaxID=1131835 RepID=UPI00260D0200|nr:NnrS family protein [uncultured Piscinibacter sp.]
MADRRWRARWLLAAPHRLGFFAAACMLALSALWWLAWMLSRHAIGLAWRWAVSPGLAHGVWFGFGFMPLFFAGFLFTAGPKWLRLPPVEARALAPAIASALAGWLLFVAGVHAQLLLAALGLVVVAAAWLAIVRRLAGLLRASVERDRVHLRVMLAAGRVGALAILATAACLLAGREDAARAAVQLGLWGFIAPVFVAAAHRLVPFLGESASPALAAWRPQWLLWTLLALCAAQWPFALADLWWWPQPGAWRALQIVADAAGALLVFALAWRWVRVQGMRTRMIAMLHVGFVWLGVSFALSALSQALLWASGGTQALGLAAPHAFTIGFLGSTMLAMTSRIASGQAGRTLAADDLAWALFLVLQLAVLLRMAATLWPAAEATLLIAAALAWTAAVGGWAVRCGRWFGRPRVDGRPG